MNVVTFVAKQVKPQLFRNVRLPFQAINHVMPGAVKTQFARVPELSSNLLRCIPMAWPKTIELLRYHRNDIFSAADFIQIREEISGKNAYSAPPIATFAQYLNQMDHHAKCNPLLYKSEIGRMMKVEALLRVAQLVPFELNTPKFEMRVA